MPNEGGLFPPYFYPCRKYTVEKNTLVEMKCALWQVLFNPVLWIDTHQGPVNNENCWVKIWCYWSQ